MHEIDTKKELLCKEVALVTQYNSVNENPSIKGLDIFTKGIKFSSTQCTIFDVSIKLATRCLYKQSY
jgi:hypothetical protein